MNPRLVFLLAVTLSMPAQAQWGVGTALGTGCPYSFRPAPQATDGSDEMANIRGYMTRDGQLRKNKESDLARVDAQLRRVKSEMARVISPDGMAAIDQHYSHGVARDRYQTVCAAGPTTTREAPPILPPWAGGPPPTAPADANFPIPSGFCYTQGDQNLNLWGGFLADDPGRLNDTICDYPVPPTRRAVDTAAISSCKNSLRDYYQLRAERERIEEELRGVRERMAGYDSRLRVIRDEVTEGRYCPTCNSERRGYSTASTGDQSMQTLGVLAGVALTLFSRHQQQRRQPPPAFLPPRPGAPAVMPYRAFPQRPYSAPLPGYMGMNNGVDYGAVPGSIGSGAFGCQGTSPLNASPMFGNAPPTVFGGPSPWDNPFAQPIMNPQLSSPLYNSGFGPTLGPIMNTLFNGLGGPNRMMGSGMVDPFGAPTTLPYWGNYTGNGALVPPLFGNDPFAYDPLGPGMVGAPGSFGPGFGGGRGGNAPAVLPYTGSLSAVANGGFSSSFGSPVGNYYNQVQQIKYNIHQIQNGSYFGSAPTVLPYPGSSARPNPPPVLPYKNK